MARIPTADALDTPSIRADRPAPTVDRREAADFGATGEALGQLGSAFGAAATEARQRQQQDETFEVERRLVEFQGQQEQAFEEARRNMPADGVGFADSWRRTSETAARAVGAQAVRDGFSNRALDRLDLGLTRSVEGNLWGHALRLETAARESHQTDLLHSTLRGLQDRAVADPSPATTSSLITEGSRLIDTSRLTAAQRRAELDRFRLDTTRAAIEQRAATASTIEEQEAILRDLRTLQRTGGMAAVGTPSGRPDLAESARRGLEADMGGADASGGAPATASPVAIEPLPGNRTMAGVRPRPENTQVSGVVLHHTSGSTLEGALSQNALARTGYHYYIDRDGTAYQAVADDQQIAHIMPPGNRARRPGASPNLSSANTIGIAVVAGNDADITDAQHATLQRLVEQVADKYGIAPENVVGHGELQTTREADEGSYARAYREARRNAGGGTGEGATLPGGNTSTATSAGTQAQIPGEGYTFSDAAPYPQLSVHDRRTIIDTLRTRFRAGTLPLLRQGLEAIVNGDEPARDSTGRTALDLARRTMTPLQIEHWQHQWDHARDVRDATTPIYRMNPTELGEYTANLPPDIRGPVTRRADRLLELYDKDPARAVSGGDLQGTDRRPPVSYDPATGAPSPIAITGNEDIRLPAHPAVKAAYDLIRNRRGLIPGVSLGIGADGSVSLDQRPEALSGTGAGAGSVAVGTDEQGNPVPVRNPATDRRLAQEEWRILVEGRLAAQRAMGVTEENLAPITRQEAAALLNIPQRVSDDRQFRNLLQAAADRAYGRYGPYARMALETALRYRANLSTEQSQIATSLLRSMVSGEPMPRDQMDRLARVAGIDRQLAAWQRGGTYYPSAGFQEATGIGPSPIGMPLPAGTPPPAQGWWGGAPAQSAGPTAINNPGAAAQEAFRQSGPTRTAAPGVSVAGGRRPPPEEVEYLRQHPQIWQEFDRDYGAGSAAQYLQSLPRP